MLGYMITTFACVFWLFRVIVTFLYTSESGFPIVPLNITFEIVLLFITFVCIILVAKRKMFGAVLYLIAQTVYFGIDAYKTLEVIMNGQATNYATFFISLVAVIIPLLSVLDIGLSTGKKGSGKNRKTDWFYGTTDYERNFDDRVDKNQYKF